MNSIEIHKRISAQGQAMGKNISRLSELGRKRLVSLGLSDIDAPAMRGTMCKSCACKPNTVPNGCLQTQMDFLKSVAEGEKFLCHAPKDGRVCAGWINVRAEITANPLPQSVSDLLSKWEYSPPDAIEDNT
jgi:hypothetical protein